MKLTRFTLAAITLAVTVLPAAASAQVRYQFQAFSSIVDATKPQSITGSFDLTLPTFLSSTSTLGSPQIIPLAAFTSCTVNNPGYSCNANQYFQAAQYSGYDALSFRINQPNGTLQGPLYYFADNAFSTFGTFDSLVLGPDQAGRLTVSAAVAAVPEPATWAMMIAGFGLAGFAMRRRQPAARVHFA